MVSLSCIFVPVARHATREDARYMEYIEPEDLLLGIAKRGDLSYFVLADPVDGRVISETPFNLPSMPMESIGSHGGRMFLLLGYRKALIYDVGTLQGMFVEPGQPRLWSGHQIAAGAMSDDGFRISLITRERRVSVLEYLYGVTVRTLQYFAPNKRDDNLRERICSTSLSLNGGLVIVSSNVGKLFPSSGAISIVSR